MFDATSKPRVFACAPGVDFPAALLRGIQQRLDQSEPEAWARTTVIVNTSRMARRLTKLLSKGPPRLLPRIALVTDLDSFLPAGALPDALPALRRRLELAPLIARLIEQERDLAAQDARFDLADSLARLMDEMQGEGVSAQDIMNLDVSDQSEHWIRAQKFFGIADNFVTQMRNQPDPEARRRQAVMALIENWKTAPLQDPVLIAGSTGSRGTTQLLMRAVSQLPQGAVILPGFDFDMPERVWTQLQKPLLNDKLTRDEDHPQFRFAQMMHLLDLRHDDVIPWVDLAPPSPERNAIVSLALRPAPITDDWRAEGPKHLGDLERAMTPVTLVEANTRRAEATAIAMRLRMSAQEGRKSALITPDRMLARQVTAALSRWSILPDDSAGTPLHLTPTGRFLRHIAGLLTRPLDAETLITVLKHPITHSAEGRPEHQRFTLRLEGQMRKDGLPYPDAQGLNRMAARAALGAEDTDFDNWNVWLTEALPEPRKGHSLPLVDWVAKLLACAERIARGRSAEKTSLLWARDAGEKAQSTLRSLEAQAPYGGALHARDFVALLDHVLKSEDVRNPEIVHPDIMIWGTLEARVQGADLVILGGLNDGIWPAAPAADPWLNRKMRADAGLLLPERQIGLSAHDFQQAFASKEVWLTRSVRSDDAETVPSRWINRLHNLITGLPGDEGVAAWKAMNQRGDAWLDRARLLDKAPQSDGAKRPSPRPPVHARPRKLSVTEIQTLIRDPYAIYAKHVLRLKPLRPLTPTPDALLRGIILHDVMERFVRDIQQEAAQCNVEHFLQLARETVDLSVPWPTARILWMIRIERAAEWIVETEMQRLTRGTPAVLERDDFGRMMLPEIGFEIEGRADRIDLDAEGNAILYDYKSTNPPSASQQAHFDKQLLIEAAMVEQGGFSVLGPRQVRGAQFIGLSGQKTSDAPLDEEPTREVRDKLVQRLSALLDPSVGFTSRRAVYKDGDERDYDQLARFGEWDAADPPQSEDLI